MSHAHGVISYCEIKKKSHIVLNLVPFLEVSAAVKDRKLWISESVNVEPPEARETG